MNKVLGLFLIFSSMFILNTSAQIEKNNLQYNIKVFTDTGIMGNMTIELFPFVAPKQVAYFDSLVKLKFFDSTAFHRVVPGFVIQGGDPNSKNLPRNTWGQGDPNQEDVEAEFSKINYARGILGAARDADTNSANSQFFICVASASGLNGKYTVYGRQITNFELLDKIVNAPRDANDNPNNKISMVVSYIGENVAIPGTCTHNSPADGAGNIGSSRILSFTKVTDAVLYQVQISEKADFSTLFYSALSGGNTLGVNNLAPGKKYYWRVRANNGGRYGSFSNPTWFSTTGYTGLKNPEKKNPLTIQNPVQENKIKFQFNSESYTPISFDLLSIDGKIILSEKININTLGKNTIEIPISKNLSGNYLIKINQGKEIYVNEVIIM